MAMICKLRTGLSASTQDLQERGKYRIRLTKEEVSEVDKDARRYP